MPEHGYFAAAPSNHLSASFGAVDLSGNHLDTKNKTMIQVEGQSAGSGGFFAGGSISGIDQAPVQVEGQSAGSGGFFAGGSISGIDQAPVQVEGQSAGSGGFFAGGSISGIDQAPVQVEGQSAGSGGFFAGGSISGIDQAPVQVEGQSAGSGGFFAGGSISGIDQAPVQVEGQSAGSGGFFAGGSISGIDQAPVQVEGQSAGSGGFFAGGSISGIDQAPVQVEGQSAGSGGFFAGGSISGIDQAPVQVEGQSAGSGGFFAGGSISGIDQAPVQVEGQSAGSGGFFAGGSISGIDQAPIQVAELESSAGDDAAVDDAMCKEPDSSFTPLQHIEPDDLNATRPSYAVRQARIAWIRSGESLPALEHPAALKFAAQLEVEKLASPQNSDPMISGDYRIKTDSNPDFDVAFRTTSSRSPSAEYMSDEEMHLQNSAQSRQNSSPRSNPVSPSPDHKPQNPASPSPNHKIPGLEPAKLDESRSAVNLKLCQTLVDKLEHHLAKKLASQRQKGDHAMQGINDSSTAELHNKIKDLQDRNHALSHLAKHQYAARLRFVARAQSSQGKGPSTHQPRARAQSELVGLVARTPVEEVLRAKPVHDESSYQVRRSLPPQTRNCDEAEYLPDKGIKQELTLLCELSSTKEVPASAKKHALTYDHKEGEATQSFVEVSKESAQSSNYRDIEAQSAANQEIKKDNTQLSSDRETEESHATSKGRITVCKHGRDITIRCIECMNDKVRRLKRLERKVHTHNTKS